MGCRGALLLLLATAGACAPKGPQRPPELEAAHRRALEHPGDGDAYLELAQRYFAASDLLRARQYLGLAERLPVRDEKARLHLGLALTIRLGLYDDAVVRIRRELERSEDPQLRLLLASVLEGMGRPREAEIERLMVQGSRPEDAHLLIDNARFYQRWRAAELQRSGGQGTTLAPPDPRAAELLRRYLALAPTGPEAPQARAALRAMELQQGGDNATAAAPAAKGQP